MVKGADPDGDREFDVISKIVIYYYRAMHYIRDESKNKKQSDMWNDQFLKVVYCSEGAQGQSNIQLNNPDVVLPDCGSLPAEFSLDSN